MIKYLLFAFISISFTSATWVANDISGTWINADKDAHIKIYSSYGKFYGQVVWMKFPNDSITRKPQVDKFNKDPKLRTRTVMHMLVLQNLVFDSGEQEWIDGTIYNPKDGSSYDVYCKLKDKNALEMNFYMTLRSLGKTFVWTRVP